MTEKAIQVWDGDGSRQHGNPHDRLQSKRQREKVENLIEWEERLQNESASIQRLYDVYQETHENARYFRAGGRKAASFLTGIGFAQMLTMPFLVDTTHMAIICGVPGLIAFICGWMTLKYFAHGPNREHDPSEVGDAFLRPGTNTKPKRPEPEQTRVFATGIIDITPLLPPPPKWPRKK